MFLNILEKKMELRRERGSGSRGDGCDLKSERASLRRSNLRKALKEMREEATWRSQGKAPREWNSRC